MSDKPRIIAFYLPQFHPIAENNIWWGKGFTEWTNVGKAKKYFPGHYQPKIPADLGYYDLRIPDVREGQAELAREAGVEGFCYWHYWFAGKRIMERPFTEVLASGKPDFPFCLCWANHSWYAKTWNKDLPDKLLVEQTYPGTKDHERHFFSILPAMNDRRYMRVDNKPIFGLFSPLNFPNAREFIDQWNNLAIKNGLKGIFFVTISFKPYNNAELLNKGFDAIIYDATFLRKSTLRYVSLLAHKLFRVPQIIDYVDYYKTFLSNMPVDDTILPCVFPNYDHTPRSGRRGALMTNSTPENFNIFLRLLLQKIKNKSGEQNMIFVKSWNEWGEGNYMEPDIRYGKGYITAMRDALESVL